MQVARARCEANRQWCRVGWMLADHRDRLSSSHCKLDPRLLSRVVSWHSVSWRFGVWGIRQRNTACVLSNQRSLACARASKLTTTNMYIARTRCESQPLVGPSGHYDTVKVQLGYYCQTVFNIYRPLLEPALYIKNPIFCHYDVLPTVTRGVKPSTRTLLTAKLNSIL